jgi:membrane-associated phospholipid phosphatase
MKPESVQTQLFGHLSIGAGLLGLAIVTPSLLLNAALLAYFALLADSFLRQADPKARALNFRLGVGIALFLVLILPLAAQVQSALRPQTLDQVFRTADLALHLDGFALSRFCLLHTSAKMTVIVVYAGLPLVFALAWILSRSHELLYAAVLAALLAQPCYLLFPACGPQYAFAGWPFSPALLAGEISPLHARNCMPSLHFTWAMLAAGSVRGRWRWAFVGYAGLMSLATVAGGEHYFVDVLAAFPFAWLVTKLTLFCRRYRAARGSQDFGFPAPVKFDPKT